MSERAPVFLDASAPLVERVSSTVEAAALARLHDYMRREPSATEREETIARDAYVAGFTAGGRWALRTSSQLADPRVQAAVAVLAELLLRQEP